MHNIITALVTPMFPDGSIDFKSIQQLVEFQLNSGICCLVVAGTTGESSTLNVTEHIDVISAVHRYSACRAQIIAGAGSNSTEEAVELTKHVVKLGIQTTLQVTPYYVKPSQDGLYQHFKRIAEAVDADHIIYNVPTRSGICLQPSTITKLAQVPNIVGIKDTRTNILALHKILKQRSLKLYSGDDMSWPATLKLGCTGLISVAANLFPRLMQQLWRYLHKPTQPSYVPSEYCNLCNLLFVETNPVPIKWLLSQFGFSSCAVRLPLVDLNTSFHAKIIDQIRLLLNWEA